MYKIMLADDEGIVIDSLKFIIEKNFGKECIVEYAKTGRSVIELAEAFRPDIAIMDIHMPGINGIEAIKEIQKFNKHIIFIVMSAYDKFDYAKEAINLGVLEYLNKPVNRDTIVAVLQRSMQIIDDNREKRSNELLIKEKIENVIPLIESGFIYNILFQDDYLEDIMRYQELLGIEENCGYLYIVECGDKTEGYRLGNVVGAGVKIQSYYQDIRAIIKDCMPGIVGPLMANRIIVFMPVKDEVSDYNQRIHTMESCRVLLQKLTQKIDIQFRIGIGSVKRLDHLIESHREALNSLRNMDDEVVHIQDMAIGCAYDADYPIQIEKRLFDRLKKGDVSATMKEAEAFFNWMEEAYPEAEMAVKLKVTEFVLYAEHLAYINAAMTYHFTDRAEYLTTIIGFEDYQGLKKWFVDKITDSARNIQKNSVEEQSSGTIARAKAFINNNYQKDISLDEVSREMDVSPYYFSKLFKEETGENFIEYLTAIRIAKAKELLENTDRSMKEICVEVGYQDPNYFSRIFKKNEGLTPTEYKENR